MNNGVTARVICIFAVSMVLASSGLIICHVQAMNALTAEWVEGADVRSASMDGEAVDPTFLQRSGVDGTIYAMMAWAVALLVVGVMLIRHLLHGPFQALLQASAPEEDSSAKAIEALEEMNRELTDFAQIVSHDLKAPLRGIRCIVQWMAEDWDEKLDDEDRVQIDHLTRRVGRMQDLIDGILDYSKAGHGTLDVEPVDLNALVPEVVDALCPPSGIHVQIAPFLPTVTSSPVQLMQVLQNLIGNAVKHMDRSGGIIEVKGRDTPGFWELSVTDNGPGIPEKYHEKIFEVFQVLAPRDCKESTGVGLAVVKKIVEAGGGRVWVESKESEGCTFYFTLPKTNARVNEGKG